MLLKYEKYSKLNEEVSIDELRELCGLIWQHYPQLAVNMNNGLITVIIEDNQRPFSCTYNEQGLELVNTYLNGIILGMKMSGKTFEHKKEPKKIVSKLDPFGEEDWNN